MVQNITRLIFAFSALLYVVCHFLELIFKHEIFLHSLSLFGLTTLLSGLFMLTKRSIALPMFLIVLAFLISIFNKDAHWLDVAWLGSRSMRSLLPMLFVIPFVGWVLKQEDYVEDTIVLLKSRLKRSRSFYGALMLMTQIISFFLLFGAIVVVYQIVQTFLKEKDTPTWKDFKATAILRGFSFSTIWVVSMASFAYTVEMMDAPLMKTFIQGFIVSLVGAFIAMGHLYLYEKKHKINFSKDLEEVISKVARNVEGNTNRYRNPIEFAILFLTLVSMTFLFNWLLPIGLLSVIPLVVVLWVLVYFILKKKGRILLNETKHYVTKGIASSVQQWSLLLAVGLLIVALDLSGISEAMMQGIYHWSEETLGLNFLWVLPIIVLLLGFIGIGPLSVTVLISGILLTIYLPYDPEIIVLAMTLGSALSVLLSPLIIPSILLSSVNGRSTFENSVMSNWKYAIVIYIVVESYIQLAIL